ncbi:MAG: 2-amino-4-hydroxy-6-hydroxymethyldihydropteridine diphosphokinase [bacterium]
MAIVYISIGSNINPAENVRQSLRLLVKHVRIIHISTLYLNEAIDRPEQPQYYNGVIAIETEQPPVDLKYNILRAVETQLGRNRTLDKSAPRPIDLDILIYDEMVIDSPEIMLPDPWILKRPFIAIPLYELAPNLVLPKYRSPIKNIAAKMDCSKMQPLDTYTQMLRKEFITYAEKKR